MNGSAKQVEWAMSIKSNMIAEIERMRALFNSSDVFDRYVRIHSKDADAETVEQSRQDFAIGNEILNAAEATVNAMTEARWFIDNRKSSVIATLDRKTIRHIEGQFNCDVRTKWMALGLCR